MTNWVVNFSPFYFLRNLNNLNSKSQTNRFGDLELELVTPACRQTGIWDL